MITVLVIIFLFLAASFCAVKFLSLNVFGVSICKIKNADTNTVFLSFDDGPNGYTTPFVLNLLEKYGHKATFFCIARNAEKYPEIIKQIVAGEHTLASHDLEHLWTSNFRLTKRMTEEIGESVRILEEISNTKIKYYRPPVGLSNPHLFRALKLLNLQCVGWSKSVTDNGNRNVLAIKKLPSLSNSKKGDIILLHDDSPVENSDLFLQKLEELLINLKKQNKISRKI